MYTAIIAAKGGDAHIADALASIFGQSRPPASVDVVLDAADLDHQPWLSAISRHFPAVNIRYQPDSGMANALGFGIRSVTTPYVAFLDCDDVWEPEKQRRQVEALEADEGLHAVTCLAANEWSGSSIRSVGEPTASAMFTSTTFRTSAFTHFGFPDGDASHYTWLYRWWAHARQRGIMTSQLDYVGLRRRIHNANSWVTGNAEAHRALLQEVRAVAQAKREGAYADHRQ